MAHKIIVSERTVESVFRSVSQSHRLLLEDVLAGPHNAELRAAILTHLDKDLGIAVHELKTGQ